ncbi:hypothetical protein BS47DRAFT_703763 [Hydnum rufescens UP504]|uniref:Histidinol-phosphatase n=1 Tax=Hydnum rufescens UP504 TaxID=1448309 RepID=A0A9P6B1V0_9AGAM|nr:hypothetical protein BS47DRAFT_703763 [Hydnum rufescens UP504]
MHSHHSHSGEFCKHASGSLSAVVDAAISSGFAVYGLSEHAPRYRQVDLYPEEQSLSPQALHTTFDQFINEAGRLQTFHSQNSQISLLVGVETEYITPLDLSGLQTILAKYGDAIDYVVGSIHHVNEIPIDFDLQNFNCALASFSALTTTSDIVSPPTVAIEGLEDLILSYLDAQYTVLTTIHPEIIGHFDLFRLYYPSLNVDTLPSVWDKVRRNVTYAIEYGALFELNAAAFRKGWDSAYPGREIADFIISQGGRFALSDDSHGPAAVGLNYSRLRTYLYDTLGVKELWYLERSVDDTSRSKGGRRVQAVKVQGAWWQHPFWEKTL